MAIVDLTDFTPFHLRQYHHFLCSHYADYSIWEYYSRIIMLLKRVPSASRELVLETNKKSSVKPSPISFIERYPKAEFIALRNAARRTLQSAHARITAAYALSKHEQSKEHPDWLRARVLHEVLHHGRPRTKEGIRALETSYSSMGPNERVNAARRQLFLSSEEALAAVVLLGCQRGLNISTIDSAPVPFEHEPGVMQLDLDKPRRGAAYRYWPELVLDGTDPVEDSEVQALQMIAEATEPAREHLALRGIPTDRLFAYWPTGSRSPLLGVPRWEVRKKAAWVPKGTAIDFRRLRRSIPGAGVTAEPTNHSAETHLHYVRSDATALAHHQAAAMSGIQKVLDHGRARVELRMSENEEMDSANDALIVNCSDPANHPDTSSACTSGFYGFLDCLQCANAATVPRLLPRMIAALQVLEELRDGMGESWDRRFARHHATLSAVVDRYTVQERELASKEVAQHLPVLLAALRHEPPA
ncbi:hypothetical protein GC088_10065 [Arthrobacter sp. JZ12]|uniref:hypothetical protein n=1 Tax=Arthrobacter sp. JZ12 TaxID=2654190 RepID=UPI002B493086|nr:hypothetical protein [Arthrobacter sp. JZ12]WRH25372.1 hypothetical protein GC088_10065 [Arthrobacter sp. JZ12]